MFWSYTLLLIFMLFLDLLYHLIKDTLFSIFNSSIMAAVSSIIGLQYGHVLAHLQVRTYIKLSQLSSSIWHLIFVACWNIIICCVYYNIHLVDYLADLSDLLLFCIIVLQDHKGRLENWLWFSVSFFVLGLFLALIGMCCNVLVNIFTRYLNKITNINWSNLSPGSLFGF